MSKLTPLSLTKSPRHQAGGRPAAADLDLSYRAMARKFERIGQEIHPSSFGSRQSPGRAQIADRQINVCDRGCVNSSSAPPPPARTRPFVGRKSMPMRPQTGELQQVVDQFAGLSSLPERSGGSAGPRSSRLAMVFFKMRMYRSIVRSGARKIVQTQSRKALQFLIRVRETRFLLSQFVVRHRQSPVRSLRACSAGFFSFRDVMEDDDEAGDLLAGPNRHRTIHHVEARAVLAHEDILVVDQRRALLEHLQPRALLCGKGVPSRCL